MKKLFKKIILIIVLILLFNIFVNNKINIAKTESIYDTDLDPLSYISSILNEEVYNARTNISQEERKENNITVLIISIILFIYWIILLYNYEKEDKINYRYVDEKELLKRYNPLIAGCLVDSRDVLSRDIIATILNLVNKGIIKLEIIQNLKNKHLYRYELSRIKEKESEMDATEAYIHSWIFEFIYNEDEKVDLAEKLKNISKQQESYGKFEKLNEIAKKQLNKMGANKANVSIPLEICNIIMLIVSILISARHIMSNGLDVQIYNKTVIIIAFIIISIIFIIPVIVFLGYVILKILAYSKRIINKLNEHITGQKIVSTSIAVILAFTLMIILTLIYIPNKYLVFDEILIGIAILIVVTDNLMLKNDKKILSDFYNLKKIKYNIENYSLLGQKDVEHIKLWEEYLTYAIAFGVPEEIINKMKKMYLQDLMIEDLKNYDLLYFTCKSYLEVFWDMKFKKKTKPIDKIKNFFEI